MSRLKIFIASCALGAAGCGNPPPPRATGGKLAAAVRDARFAAPCGRAVGMEWPAGRPVPIDGANGRRFKVFFYPLSGRPGTPARLATPAAEAVLDADSGAPVECRALPGIAKDLASPRWTSEARGLGDDAFDAKSVELDQLTEDISAVYAARRPPTTADADLARRYLDDFQIMAEPPLLPDYYRLNPAFWEWVRLAAGRSIPKA